MMKIEDICLTTSIPLPAVEETPRIILNLRDKFFICDGGKYILAEDFDNDEYIEREIDELYGQLSIEEQEILASLCNYEFELENE